MDYNPSYSFIAVPQLHWNNDRLGAHLIVDQGSSSKTDCRDVEAFPTLKENLILGYPFRNENCRRYCWWLKSYTTTWDGAETLWNNGKNYRSLNWWVNTGFQPSTVGHRSRCDKNGRVHFRITTFCNKKSCKAIEPNLFSSKLRRNCWKTKKCRKENILVKPTYLDVPGS